MKRQGILFCLIGPTAGGKTTLGERLIKEFHPSMHVSVSVTSRTPRPDERDGVSYRFVSREEFQAKVKRGEFFEWEEIHDTLYGTLQSTLDGAISGGYDLLLNIDIRGALNVKSRFPGSTIITFVVPPSFAVLTERLEKRGAVSAEERRRRTRTAIEEYRTLLGEGSGPGGIDYFVVNDQLETAYEQVRSVVVAERTRLARLSRKDLETVCRVDDSATTGEKR